MTVITRDPTGLDSSSGTWDSTLYSTVADYPDSSSSYLTHGTTAGNATWTVNTPTVPAGATGISVAIKWYSEKSASPIATMGGRIKIGSSYYDGSQQAQTTTPALYTATWATNPATSAAWTVAEANSIAAAGVVSSDASPTIYLYSVQLQITYLNNYSLTCDYATLALTGQDVAFTLVRKITCDYVSLSLAGQDVTLTYDGGGYTLTCEYASLTFVRTEAYFYLGFSLILDYASFSLAGQDAAFQVAYVLRSYTGYFTLAGQDVTLTYSVSTYSLTCEVVTYTLAGMVIEFIKIPTYWFTCEGNTYTLAGMILDFSLDTTYSLTCEVVTYSLAGMILEFISGSTYSLTCNVVTYTLAGMFIEYIFGLVPFPLDYTTYTSTGGTVRYFYGLWEPTDNMITFGTLLTRIQHALGDSTGTTWSRTDTIWNFAMDAIRAFPILRPKTIIQIVEDAGHSFTLPADFRKLIYVEYPVYQDPPEYLRRKAHLDATFFGEDGYYDVDRDYDSGEDYILWVSNDLAVDDVVSVRYLATHTTEFANEYSYITIENQYVQVIVNHVVLMCFQERLGVQLQDPTAHTSTIQQMSEAVKSAEAVYLKSLQRAEEEVSSSQRIQGWKVDKHDRIY